MYTHKEGIRFRKVTKYDLPRLLELKQESWWGTHKALMINPEDQERWYNSLGNNELVLIAEHLTVREVDTGAGKFYAKEKKEVYVSCGVAVYSNIDWINRSLSISGSIYKDFRKPEITKPAFAGGLDYAFEMMNMRRVEAEVLDYNIPAQDLEIEFLKFKVEGRKRAAVYKSGRYYDSIMLGLLRGEWEQTERVKGYGDSCNKDFSPDKMSRLANRFSPSTNSA